MVKISNLAGQDIDSIIDYTIENFGTDAMINHHESLEKCFNTIDNSPKIGLKSDDIIKNYYRFNHRSHVVFYQILPEGVLIVRVLHNSMDVKKHL